ncbi:MAG TPA: hypothetical protein VKA48_01350 [Gammaproteobacteria bacterium]|nr:hypothetical protein [Gammaproteobacteria bacterium]
MLEGILLAVGTFSGPLFLLLGFGVIAFINRTREEPESSDTGTEDASDDYFSIPSRRVPCPAG